MKIGEISLLENNMKSKKTTSIIVSFFIHLKKFKLDLFYKKGLININ